MKHWRHNIKPRKRHRLRSEGCRRAIMSKIVLTNIDKFYGKNHVLKNLNLPMEK